MTSGIRSTPPSGPSLLSAADLAQCASEPIRVPGAIQPHGCLAAFRADTGALVAYSENWAELLGLSSPDVPSGLSAILPAALANTNDLTDGEGPASRGMIALSGQLMHVTAHRAGGLVHLEFEADSTEPGGTQAPIYLLARHMLPQMQQARSVESLHQLAVDEMKQLTGFGRCLIYRFDEEGHGAVMAEALDEGYESYLDHRFPAADIPAQARELYRINHIRLIPNANYQPVPIRFVDGQLDGAGFDMSQAALRSVSPVHLEYMRNMGTLASMSVSIIVRGRLWGLISCHDHQPRYLSYPSRIACEHLGNLLSLHLEAKEDNALVSEQLELRQLTLAMVSHLSDSDATLQRLVEESAPLLRMARATGAAVILNDRCWHIGETPDAETLVKLGEWLGHHIRHEYHTDALQAQAPHLDGLGDHPGLLAISISQVHRHYIVWFRPEVVRTIKWAGDPRKDSLSPDGRLHPRRSFSTWREQVREQSLPWNDAEVNAALELRQALIGIVLRRAEELNEVATELGRVNKELEAFSYTVSHDLRAPMRHISGYVDLVIDSEGKQLSERSHRYLRHVKDASSYAGQLVDALLDFSRMGRSALKRTDVKLELLVDELIAEVGRSHRDRVIHWVVERPLPTLWADPILIQVAMRNLIGNAVKYTRERPEAHITIRPRSDAAGLGVEVSDDGVGFQMKYVGKLFGVFQRLHQAEEYEGTGIGLASVRRIVERHGGQVHAQGAPGRGAAFGFTIPPQPETPRLTPPPPTEASDA